MEDFVSKQFIGEKQALCIYSLCPLVYGGVPLCEVLRMDYSFLCMAGGRRRRRS